MLNKCFVSPWATKGTENILFSLENFWKDFAFDGYIFTFDCQIVCQGSHFFAIETDDGHVILTVLFSISSILFTWDSNMMWWHSLMRKLKRFYWNHDARKHVWINATLRLLSWTACNPPIKPFTSLYFWFVWDFSRIWFHSLIHKLQISGFYVNYSVFIKLNFQFMSRN